MTDQVLGAEEAAGVILAEVTLLMARSRGGYREAAGVLSGELDRLCPDTASKMCACAWLIWSATESERGAVRDLLRACLPHIFLSWGETMDERYSAEPVAELNAQKAADEALVSGLVQLIKPLFAGHPPEIQGAVLADLLATWLSGHMIPGDPQQTRGLRDELLTFHIAFVRELVEPGAN